VNRLWPNLENAIRSFRLTGSSFFSSTDTILLSQFRMLNGFIHIWPICLCLLNHVSFFKHWTYSACKVVLLIMVCVDLCCVSWSAIDFRVFLFARQLPARVCDMQVSNFTSLLAAFATPNFHIVLFIRATQHVTFVNKLQSGGRVPSAQLVSNDSTPRHNSKA
jgi:hypothetical protein